MNYIYIKIPNKLKEEKNIQMVLTLQHIFLHINVYVDVEKLLKKMLEDLMIGL